MDLAIVNKSATFVTAPHFCLAPGQKIKASCYYPDEKAIRADLVLQKLVAKGVLAVVPVDFIDPAVVMQKEMELRAREDEAKHQGFLARRQKELDRRLARRRLRAEAQAKKRAKTAVQAAQPKAEVSDLDLSALFEASRKQSLERLREEEAARRRPQPAPVTETVVADDPLADDSVVVPAFSTPVEVMVDAPAEPVVWEVSSQEPDKPAEHPVDVEAPENPFDQMDDQELREAFAKENPPAGPLDHLDDDDLRKVLRLCSVRGAHLMKKRATLESAVLKLELAPDDIAGLLQE